MPLTLPRQVNVYQFFPDIVVEKSNFERSHLAATFKLASFMLGLCDRIFFFHRGILFL